MDGRRRSRTSSSKLRLVLAMVSLCSLGAWAAVAPDKGVAGVVSETERGAERPRRWAVLIGVNRYTDAAGIGDLSYCVADMRLLYKALTGPGGGFDPKNVLLMVDDSPEEIHRPTYSNIVAMVPRWLEDAGPDDDVLIAFSGHGINEDGEAYLLPSSARMGRLRLTAVPLKFMREWMDACKARRKLLLLDCCHSGAGKAPAIMKKDFLDELEKGEGFVRLASCGPDQKSNEDKDLASAVSRGHGVFSFYLCEGLGGAADYDRDGRIDVDEAYRYAMLRTREWARGKGLRQDPVKSGAVTGLITIAYQLPAPSEPVRVPPAQEDRPALPGPEGRPGPALAMPSWAEKMLGDGRISKTQRDYANEAGLPVARDLDLGGGVTLGLVLVPPGEFMMGSPAEPQRYRYEDDERPRHRVRITRPFYIGIQEVTQAQYRAIMNANPSDREGADLPVETVSWADAASFCRKLSEKTGLGVRLPTEAEWEYVCRAGTTTQFYFGDELADINQHAWHGGEGDGQWSTADGRPHPVGQKAPNPWGVFDVYGNVWEWCQDWYGGEYYRASPEKDPAGPPTGEGRVVRGGSWERPYRQMYSSLRHAKNPDEADRETGFRIVVQAEPRKARER